MKDFQYITNSHPDYIENIYNDFLKDPNSIDQEMRKFFEGFDLGAQKYESGEVVSEDAVKEIQVLNLIHGYRQRGHLFSQTNPIRQRRNYTPTLDLENFGLEQSDLEKSFNAGIEVGLGPAKLKDIIAKLHKTYCGSIGCEFSYIRDPKRRTWLQERFEQTQNVPNLTTDEKIPTLYRFIVRKRFVCSIKLEVRAHRLPWCLCSCSNTHVDQWLGQF